MGNIIFDKLIMAFIQSCIKKLNYKNIEINNLFQFFFYKMDKSYDGRVHIFYKYITHPYAT